MTSPASPVPLEELERLAVSYAGRLRALGNEETTLEAHSAWSAAEDDRVAALLDSLLSTLREQQAFIVQQGTAGGIAGTQLVEKLVEVESLRVTVSEQQQEIARLSNLEKGLSVALGEVEAERDRLRAFIETVVQRMTDINLWPSQRWVAHIATDLGNQARSLLSPEEP